MMEIFLFHIIYNLVNISSSYVTTDDVIIKERDDNNNKTQKALQTPMGKYSYSDRIPLPTSRGRFVIIDQKKMTLAHGFVKWPMMPKKSHNRLTHNLSNAKNYQTKFIFLRHLIGASQPELRLATMSESTFGM